MDIVMQKGKVLSTLYDVLYGWCFLVLVYSRSNQPSERLLAVFMLALNNVHITVS